MVSRAGQPLNGAAVLAQLPPGRGQSVVRDGATTIVVADPVEVRSASGEDAFAVARRGRRAAGFWVGYLAYDLGRTVERVDARPCRARGARARRRRGPTASSGSPTSFSRATTRASSCEPGLEPSVVGDGPAAEVLAQAAWRAQREHESSYRGLHRARGARRSIATRMPPRCDEILELLDAGECYQVNLTRRLRAAARRPIPSACTSRSIAPTRRRTRALCTFGALLPSLAIVSASPELFLRRRRTHGDDPADQGNGAATGRRSRPARRTAPRT